ncbi:TadE/TadG family type IV pilus assembly protein [Rhodoblastus sp.]|uniref:TadE/TadG family type IV pilus assembly protein n=1 Tax=Rhodoblastus sp. TaxID=1962975 RepID=UPI003F95DEB4
MDARYRGDVVLRMAGSSRKLLVSFVANVRGAIALEFALLAAPFFAILIAIFQVGAVYVAENELETATEMAARQLLTGQVQNAGLTASQFAASMCPNLHALFSCSGLMVDLENVGANAADFASANVSAPTLTYNAQGQVTNNWNFLAGGAGSILVLRVMYQLPVILGGFGLKLANLPNGDHLLMTTSVFEVEPYNGLGT